MAKSLKDLAIEALAVQDACNLCAVAQGFARAMIDLGEHTRGTDQRNSHPVAVLWADKIAHLTHTQSLGHDVVSHAYTACHELAESRPAQSRPAQHVETWSDADGDHSMLVDTTDEDRRSS